MRAGAVFAPSELQHLSAGRGAHTCSGGGRVDRCNLGASWCSALSRRRGALLRVPGRDSSGGTNTFALSAHFAEALVEALVEDVKDGRVVALA